MPYSWTLCACIWTAQVPRFLMYGWSAMSVSQPGTCKARKAPTAVIWFNHLLPVFHCGLSRPHELANNSFLRTWRPRVERAQHQRQSFSSTTTAWQWQASKLVLHLRGANFRTRHPLILDSPCISSYGQPCRRGCTQQALLHVARPNRILRALFQHSDM